jgi:hypothetical protein
MRAQELDRFPFLLDAHGAGSDMLSERMRNRTERSKRARIDEPGRRKARRRWPLAQRRTLAVD